MSHPFIMLILLRTIWTAGWPLTVKVIAPPESINAAGMLVRQRRQVG